jgi:hypothetical protein
VQSLTVNPGALQESKVSLTRASAVIEVQGTPPGAEVWVRQDAASTPRKLGVTDASGRLLVDGFAMGDYVVELRRPCFKTRASRIHVAELKDFELKSQQLDRAVGTLDVSAGGADAHVLLDGEPKGIAPLQITGVCEGTHEVLIESAVGRYTRTVTLDAGATLDIKGVLRPAVAIISLPGDGADDVARTAQRRLAASKSLDFVLATKATVPAAPDLLGQTSGLPEAIARRRAEQAQSVGEALHTQAVALVSLNKADSDRIEVRLYARGSGQPDVMNFSVSQEASMAAILQQMDRSTELFRRTVGVFAVDLTTRPHPVVAVLRSQLAGISVGDQVASIDGRPVTTASAVNDIATTTAAGASAHLGAVSDSGVAKIVEAPIAREPMLVSADDQSLFVNELLISLECLAATTTDTDERQVANLNVGVLLMRIGQWRKAENLFEHVELPAGTGVSRGTVDYLRGLCYEQLGQPDKAAEMWRAAKDAGGHLTEDGGDISALAAAKLK